MKIKYIIHDCTLKEGVYRAFLHVDGVKYSKDYSKHDYNCLCRAAIEDELRTAVIKILSERLVIEKGAKSL